MVVAVVLLWVIWISGWKMCAGARTLARCPWMSTLCFVCMYGDSGTSCSYWLSYMGVFLSRNTPVWEETKAKKAHRRT